MVSFTAEVFFSLFEAYNRAVWPAQFVAYGLGLVALLLSLRPIPGSGRIIGAILAASWAWIGGVYHLMYLATIDFAAPAFAALFLLQALLLGWTAAIRGRVAFRFRAGPIAWSGIGLAIYALAVHPLIAGLAGPGWLAAPLFGVAPGPTMIFTIGMLLLVSGRTPLHLALIPLLWSLNGGATAWLLGVPEGLALPLAGVGGVALILRKNRQQSGR